MAIRSKAFATCVAVVGIVGPLRAQAPPAAPVPPVAVAGLSVAQPKVYDTYYLQKQLQSLKTQLESVQAVSAATLTGHIGNVQGSDLQQVGVSVSASPAASASSAAVSPSTLSNPTPAQSSLDTLNESMQLAAEITNLELLLDGALNDKLDPVTGNARRVYTIGFPITFSLPDPAMAKQRENSVAEIHVALCPVSGYASVMTLLPQERTYNVAGLVDHSFSGSATGVLAGVMSVGGGFLWSHKRYDMVQQQETIALMQGSGDCGSGSSSSTAFSWQVFPVLGSKYVRAGTQQDIVQFSLPGNLPPQPGSELLRACVQIGWTKTRKSGSLVDDFVSAASQCFPVPYFDTTPTLQKGTPVKVTNPGGNTLLVTAHGSFLPGTVVRVGSATIEPPALTITGDSQTLSFMVSASDLMAAGGAYLVSREMDLLELTNPSGAEGSTPLRITGAGVAPYSDTLDVLTIHYAPPAGPGISLDPCAPIPGQPPDTTCIPSDPYLVTVGRKIYGLADAPFLKSPDGSNELRLLVPVGSVTDGSKITMQRLLWSKHDYYAEYFSVSSTVSVTKVVTTSTAKGIHLAMLGGNLDQALIKYPAGCDGCLVASSSNFATIDLSEAQAANVKEIVLCRKDTEGRCDPAVVPIFVEVPTGDSGAAPKPKPKPTTPPKPDEPGAGPKPKP